MRRTALASRMTLDEEELLPEKPAPKEPDATTTVRVPVALLQRLDEIGEAEGLSRARLIKSFLQACVRSYDRRKKRR